jgi:hypothetical protein
MLFNSGLNSVEVANHPETLRFSSTLGISSVVFISRETSFALTGSTVGAGLVLGALEDDDTDDTATGICDWVLSFRDNSSLNSLAFKPAANTSALLRALT